MKNKAKNVCIAVLIVLTIIGFVKSIFISLDIDESYAVAQAYRLARGDKLLADMWEPHQFSAYLAAVFVKLYVGIFHTVEYLVIYLRIIGILIHIGLGMLLYRALRRMGMDSGFSVILVLLHLNFLPKWVQMPEFELMHYWGLLLIAMCMMGYFGEGRKRKRYPFLAGAALVGCIFCYPTMFLLYPAYVLGWILLERSKGLRNALCFTGGSVLVGGSFLVYLSSYLSVNELVLNLSNIFMDKSHTTYTMQEKWSFYGQQIVKQLRVYPKYLLLGAACTLMAVLIAVALKRAGMGKSSDGRMAASGVEVAFVTLFLFAGILMQCKSVYGNLFEDKNQFFFQVRYVALMLPAIYLGIRYYKQMALWVWSMLIPAGLSLIAVLFITNMDTNTSYAKMFLGVLGSVMIYHIYVTDILKESMLRRMLGVVQNLAVCSLFVGLFVCRLLLIRVTGCLPITVRADMAKMEYGAEKGIYVLADFAQIWNQNYQMLEPLIRPDDRMLYIGSENLVYLAAGCEIASPSTQGTNVYNEMFLKYYELHPDRKPTVLLLDRTYETNPVYGNYFGSEPVMRWIAEEYAGAEWVETDFLTIILGNE
ncbi:MAG: hypothetical protein IJ833_10405 [Lachnospiraceae bacterium]|nr:hypothetical protein [Lachnospiraceae bacterium]